MTPTPIRHIHDRHEAMHQALRRWSNGHENGESYRVGEPVDNDPNDLEDDVGGELLLEARDAKEVAVYRMADGSEVAVAIVNGPFAVVITPPGG